MEATPVGMYAQSMGEVTFEKNGGLGREDFLQLLVASMRDQDPLNPVDNGEMIAQMATFSMLEQMLNMSESFVGLQSMSMLGRIVKVANPDGTILEGTVTSVNVNNGKPILSVDDGTTVSVVEMKNVYEISY